MSPTRKLIMSGHCATAHLTPNPDEAHARCKMEQCPHAYHYRDAERFDCGCGGTLVETDWFNPDPEDVDEDGNPEPVYVHLDHDGHVIGQECP